MDKENAQRIIDLFNEILESLPPDKKPLLFELEDALLFEK